MHRSNGWKKCHHHSKLSFKPLTTFSPVAILKLLYSTPKMSQSFLSSLQFRSCLGHGSLGIVLQAIHPPTQVPSAVKFIFLHNSSAEDRRKVLRESTLTKDFRHENVVQILTMEEKQFIAREMEDIFKDVATADHQVATIMASYIFQTKRLGTMETICLQMELCGETLRSWLNLDHATNTAIEATQFDICLGLVHGLKYLHDRKIIHRDLKPENIMFSKTGFSLPIKIGDFGLCRTLHSPETQTKSLTSHAGTLDYMSPEAFTNEYSFPADRFSLGLVIWELFQLIPFKDRKRLFDCLVNDKKDSLIIVITEVKELIVNFTKRNIKERTLSLESAIRILIECDICNKFPKNGDELRDCLRNTKSGEMIVLFEGIYEGSFRLQANNVQIVGKRGQTVLKGPMYNRCLVVVGNGCTISNLAVVLDTHNKGVGMHLVGSNNVIQDVDVSGGCYPCITVSGHENKLERLTLSNAARGIDVDGTANTIEQVQLKNIESQGIFIKGSNSNHNIVSNVVGINVRNGISVEGSFNKLCNIILENIMETLSQFLHYSDRYSTSLGVFLFRSGANNIISNLKCTGYTKGLVMHSSSSKVGDSDCGPVDVNTSNVTLINVNCGRLISIDKTATEINLINCRGHEVQASNQVSTTNCNFGKFYSNKKSLMM